MQIQEPATIAECPSCGAEVSLEATECPRCGEMFSAETTEVEVPAKEPEKPVAKKRGFREKILFYAGVALIFFGGPGIALGSWVHDVLRIPFQEFTAFEVFGSVNRLVSAVGLIVLIVGIVMLILSLRLTRAVEPDYDVGTPKGT
ncbi:MAG TPA: zinc ribbon domain-containing protein [Thermoplasmata archaeon]|nr:zinc ribbon domain-containing protein [Thermoplasmata archaeon]